MAATSGPSKPDAPVPSAFPPLVEAAWLYRADQVCPGDLPMTAAQALAAGMDTPPLCELAGLPRHADPRDVRDMFAQALEESGIALPDRRSAWRYALHRLAIRVSAGEVDPAELAWDEWSELDVETPEEQAFTALLPPCACCTEYTLGLDEATWRARLQLAASALAARPGARPGS